MRLKLKEGLGKSRGGSIPKPLLSPHMPLRDKSGVNDSKGYQASESRRNGSHTGKPAKFDQSILPSSAKGNGKGTAGSKGSRGTVENHMGDSGRGGTGRIGKHDSYKGNPTKYSEDISHSSFERLGAD